MLLVYLKNTNDVFNFSGVFGRVAGIDAHFKLKDLVYLAELAL